MLDAEVWERTRTCKKHGPFALCQSNCAIVNVKQFQRQYKKPNLCIVQQMGIIWWIVKAQELEMLVIFSFKACVFPECVARVHVSLWGSVGWGCVRLTCMPNSPQPSAWGPHGGAYSKFCKRGRFWKFQKSCCFGSRGRRGTSWYSDVFCSVWKVVLCGRCNTFATFSEDALHFLWQAQHFGDHHRDFVWQAQHFKRVLWFALCESQCQGCVKWWRGANSVASMAFCEIETSILRLQIFMF